MFKKATLKNPLFLKDILWPGYLIKVKIHVVNIVTEQIAISNWKWLNLTFLVGEEIDKLINTFFNPIRLKNNINFLNWQD